MNRTPLAALAIVLALLLHPLTPATGEVNVIRQPPSSGTNRSEAEWSAPLALPGELPEANLPSEFSGRLKAGASAERSEGTLGYDVVADSLVIQRLAHESWLGIGQPEKADLAMGIT